MLAMISIFKAIFVDTTRLGLIKLLCNSILIFVFFFFGKGIFEWQSQSSFSLGKVNHGSYNFQ